MTQVSVRPPVGMLTDDDARELLAPALIKVCADLGPKRVGASIDCDEKTVRRARDEMSTLGLATVGNLLTICPLAFEPFLARVGRRSVPADSVCNTDALPSLTGAVHKLVVATHPSSIEGVALSRCELLGAEDEIRGAFDALGGLLQRIDGLKRGEAA